MAVLTPANQEGSRRSVRRDPDVVGESSRSASRAGKRSDIGASDDDSSSLKRRSSSRAHQQQHRIEARSPKPTPVPDPAPMPEPTRPPTRRSPSDPERVRLDPRRFAELVERGEAEDARIIGPFYPRNADELEQVKREVYAKRRRGNVESDAGIWSVGEASGELMARSNLVDGRDLLGRPASDLAKRGGTGEEDEQERLARRQSEAQETCYVGNEDLSCFPTAGTRIVQDQWSRFIWNSNFPLFAQAGYVDVYLFQSDTDKAVTSWMRQDNGAGRVSFRPNDSYWQNLPAADTIQPGQNISWPFYFVVLAAGSPLTGTTSRLATWTAVQTALPVAVASSRSVASASASAASASSASAAAAASASSTGSPRAASASPTPSASDSAAVQSAVQSSLSEALESSLRASGFTSTETLAGTSTATLSDGSVVTVTATAQANGPLPGSNRNGNGLALPTYAIVLIAVLGALALLAALLAAFFILRKRRRDDSHRGSYGSRSPMMGAAAGSLAGVSMTDGGNHGETQHMLDAGLGGAAGAGAAGALAGSRGRRSLHSEDSQLFTSDEASRMADAFRNALRRPDFAPSGFDEVSGEASGDSPTDDVADPTNKDSHVSALLREELASEGKDLQSVGDRKKAELHGD